MLHLGQRDGLKQRPHLEESGSDVHIMLSCQLEQLENRKLGLTRTTNPKDKEAKNWQHPSRSPPWREDPDSMLPTQFVMCLLQNPTQVIATSRGPAWSPEGRDDSHLPLASSPAFRSRSFTNVCM